MDRWSSKTGFILAAIGSAVGIGNIWRFSAVAGQSGGGAYLIPYLLAVFAFAMPLMILELAVGRHLRGDVVTAFGSVRKEFKILGWIVCAIVFLILSYYLVITGWTLAYTGFSLMNQIVDFSEFTSSYMPVVCFFISAIAMGLIVSLGIKDGIERVVRILIPVSFVILICLAVFSASLRGFDQGVRFLFTPDFSVLSNPLIWSAAFGQAFFSLSVGYGILLTYGEYLGEDVKLLDASLIITFADLAVALVAGAVIFPVVFTFGLEPAAGAELAFSSLPKAFEVMPFGQAFAVAFFILLFFAALTSAVSMLEVGVAAAVRATGFSRGAICSALTAGVMILGLPAALSYSALGLIVGGSRVLDLMDNILGNVGLIINALLISITFTWFLEINALKQEIGSSSWIVLGITRYAVPLILTLLLFSFLIR
ncbi:MAG TPA: sodium-dependent transporter [Methanotrichaceae archaeon]|nr:sodium-dependent transporter [Methanotrichaceae archaeon]